MTELRPDNKQRSDADLALLLGLKHSQEMSTEAVSALKVANILGGRSAKVSWLRQHGVNYTKINRIISRCTGVGLTIEVFTSENTIESLAKLFDQVIEADLILLEVFGRNSNDLHEQVVAALRGQSHKPLVLLTEDASSERSVNALRAGADAVLPLNTPEDVLVARLQAMLRRWIDAQEQAN